MIIKQLSKAFATIERHQINVRKIIMHPELYNFSKKRNKSEIGSLQNVIDFKYNTIWGANIFLSKDIPKTLLIMLSDSDRYVETILI